MGCQMIKQHNGNYSIFSSNSNELILMDASPEQVLAWWHRYYLGKLVKDMKSVAETLKRVESGKDFRVYFQHTKTWRAALAEENFRAWAEDGKNDDEEYDQRWKEAFETDREGDPTPEELKQFESLRNSESQQALKRLLDHHLKDHPQERNL